MKRIARILTLAAALSLPAVALAEVRVAPSRAAPAKKRVASKRQGKLQRAPQRAPQRMIFDDDLVSAGVATGGGGPIWGERPTRHGTLNLVRANFLPELLKSADWI